MAEFFNFLEPKHYTPQEIYSMAANNQRLQTQSAIENQAMNLGLNVAQLPPMEGFGFLLGNLGGNLYQNYRQNVDQKKIDAAKTKAFSDRLGQYGEYLRDTIGQSPYPNFQRFANNLWQPNNPTYPSSYAQSPQFGWQPNNQYNFWRR